MAVGHPPLQDLVGHCYQLPRSPWHGAGRGGKGGAPLLQLQKCLWVGDTDAAESLQGKNQFTVEKSPEKPGAHSSSARQGMNHWLMLRDGSGVLGNWPSWDGAAGHRTLGLSLSITIWQWSFLFAAMGLKVSLGSWGEESLTPWLPESTLFGWMEVKGDGGSGGRGDRGR